MIDSLDASYSVALRQDDPPRFEILRAGFDCVEQALAAAPSIASQHGVSLDDLTVLAAWDYWDALEG